MKSRFGGNHFRIYLQALSGLKFSAHESMRNASFLPDSSASGGCSISEKDPSSNTERKGTCIIRNVSDYAKSTTYQTRSNAFHEYSSSIVWSIQGKMFDYNASRMVHHGTWLKWSAIHPASTLQRTTLQSTELSLSSSAHISRTTFELATMNYTFGLFAFLALLGSATMTVSACQVGYCCASEPAASGAGCSNWGDGPSCNTGGYCIACE
ncbi:hypothetical protein LENED_002104 [Lentinula edodes]|uniref:Uncharacterized protein n=1 Tax=Lentinula edodes TaxID=5353 RepID=A0A1Q3E000_LENED|nr:hypothetical protein LENED_002104 [Lentinula edodes]